MKTLLITGFEPFGGQTVNPSWAAVQQLPESIGSYVLCKLEIPTVYTAAASAVIRQAELLHADAVLCVGQAGGRDAITPERIAVNIRDARLADNAGVLYGGERVVPDGPAAYFSTLPAEKMAQTIRDAGLPGAVSNSAGCYVCNDVLYTLLHHFDGTHVRCGFIHVPYITPQGEPNLPLEQTIQALTAAITAI